MRRFPAAFLAVISIIALAGMSVTYTLWADKLQVTGTVSTGEVDIAYSGTATTNEWHYTSITNQTGNLPLLPLEAESKDVGSCLATYIAGTLAGNTNQGNPAALDNNDQGPELLQITLNNAYPFYICDVNFTVENVGTIPVKLQDLVVHNILDGTTEVVHVTKGANCWASGFQLEANVSQAPDQDATKFHKTATCTIRLEVKEEATENAGSGLLGAPAAYVLTIGDIVGQQWNEFP